MYKSNIKYIYSVLFYTLSKSNLKYIYSGLFYTLSKSNLKYIGFGSIPTHLEQYFSCFFSGTDVNVSKSNT